jgi:hypothetical protein
VFGTITKVAWPKVKNIVNDRHTWAMLSLVYRRLVHKLTLGDNIDVYFRSYV